MFVFVLFFRRIGPPMAYDISADLLSQYEQQRKENAVNFTVGKNTTQDRERLRITHGTPARQDIAPHEGIRRNHHLCAEEVARNAKNSSAPCKSEILDELCVRACVCISFFKGLCVYVRICETLKRMHIQHRNTH